MNSTAQVTEVGEEANVDRESTMRCWKTLDRE